MNGIEHHEVIIIGAGFSGIGTSIKLSEAGFDDHLLIEEGDDLGGTWHWNTYPGVAVDIPSFSYQFSFEGRSDWSRVYAPGSELLGYAHDLADKYDIRKRTRLGVRVVSAAYDEAEDLWSVHLSDGTELSTRHLIAATGVLTQPKPPQIPGLDDFKGVTVHTARWDHSLDLTGKRVGVIGTGASAVQLIPSIAPDVEQLTVFQRTPIWCLPKLDAAMAPSARAAMRRVPGVRRAARLVSQTFVELTFPIAAHYHSVTHMASVGESVGKRHLKRVVKDPEVREKLTPKYALGCKRPSFSNDYLESFNRDNVFLETDGIESVTATGVRVASGEEHELDVLVLATGFKVFEEGNMPSFGVRGPGGISLDQWWLDNRFQAYQGVSVPGFPNLFTILGPYGYNGASYFTLIENQTRHILRCLTEARKRSATRVEVTKEANDRFMESMWSRSGRQVFREPSCSDANSYYFDRNGDTPFRASTTIEAAWKSARFDLDDYTFTAVAADPSVAR